MERWRGVTPVVGLTRLVVVGTPSSELEGGFQPSRGFDHSLWTITFTFAQSALQR